VYAAKNKTFYNPDTWLRLLNLLMVDCCHSSLLPVAYRDGDVWLFQMFRLQKLSGVSVKILLTIFST
jgi:hypothetical protein